MTESDVWQLTKAALIKSSLDDAIRIENPARAGTPDIHWCMNGIEGWLELKWASQWPVRNGPLKVDHFTPQQRAWLTRRTQANGRCHLLLKVSNEWLLFQGRVAADWLGKLPREPLLTRTLLHSSGPLDHNLLRNRLTGHG